MFDKIVTEKIENIKELEKNIYKIMCEKACEVMKTILEEVDDEILKSRNTS